MVIWNIQIRLDMRCAIWNFWNFLTFSNPSWELLIWNFQMRLETIYSIWYVWNLKLFKHVMGVDDLKLSDETWNEMCYMKLLKLETFQTHHGELLIWNFQMRLEMRCAIWNFWNLSWGVAYLKLSDETWNEMCYLKLWNLFNLFKSITKAAHLKLSDETWNNICYLKFLKVLQTCHWSCLFETFRWDLKKKCYLKLLKLETFQPITGVGHLKL